ncbi:hypothetical protein [Lacticaseibacillus thailandensis]|uniref:hypothetical protein n=1 Tax=Lacticaseibacillus thailandensis TaxID=381741 RepID=UPI0006D215E6|nr:hypothetical protein [Lacticaseibacillus thailandensis]
MDLYFETAPLQSGRIASVRDVDNHTLLGVRRSFGTAIGFRAFSFPEHEVIGTISADEEQAARFELRVGEESNTLVRVARGGGHPLYLLRHGGWLIAGTEKSDSYRGFQGFSFVFGMAPVMTSGGRTLRVQVDKEADSVTAVLVAAALDRVRVVTNAQKKAATTVLVW